MSIALASVIGLVLLASSFDYTNGFHDSANSIATVVATGVLKPRWAVVWAAFWNFVAFLVFGTAVANTVAETVKRPDIGVALIFAALIGALAWNFASWHFGLPTSSTHALIGGLVGAGLVRGGWSAISSSNLEKTALFIVVSPVIGFVVALAVMGSLRGALAHRDTAKAERHFRRAQLASSAAVSLGHGANDAQKTMGLIAALLIATHHLTSHGSKIAIPLWVVLLAETSIALGTYAGGWRIVRTMGTKITKLRPVSGFAAETSAAVALITSTLLGAPVSTTHTVAGAISGVGTVNRGTGVDWRVLQRVAMAWIATLPAAALVAAGAFEATTVLPKALAAATMTAVLVAMAIFVRRSMKTSPKAKDFENTDQKGDQEEEYPMRPGAGSVIPAGSNDSQSQLAEEIRGERDRNEEVSL